MTDIINMAAAFISGTFNAFAFAGAGFIFQKLNKEGYNEEMKRHNLAMENLTKARDEWNEARLKELDRLQNLKYEKILAGRDIQQTNKDLLDVESKFHKTEPILSNFYKPGKKMTEYMNLVKYAATIPALYGLLTFLL